MRKNEFAAINGLTMYYEVYGKIDLPLVLIHGGGSTIDTTFGVMIPLLSDHRGLIAVELQAHGRTSDREGPESFEQDADDVASLLRYLRVEKANFFGFSNGGTTAMQIAIRHKQLVNKIVVVSGAFKRDGFIPGFFEGMKQATIDNMPEPLKTAYLKVAPDKNGLQAMFNKDRQRMLDFQDITDSDLRSIIAPALFMVADRDVVTVEHTLEMSRTVASGRLAVMPGTHGSFIGEICTTGGESKLPTITATLIKEFLDE